MNDIDDDNNNNDSLYIGSYIYYAIFAPPQPKNACAVGYRSFIQKSPPPSFLGVDRERKTRTNFRYVVYRYVSSVSGILPRTRGVFRIRRRKERKEEDSQTPTPYNLV
jgi:hypothetical protein